MVNSNTLPGIREYVEDAVIAALSETYVLGMEENALRWQKEPPTEPVKRCLVRLNGESDERVFKVRRAEMIPGLILCFQSDIIWSPISDMPPGTEYCLLGDIAEAEVSGGTQ